MGSNGRSSDTAMDTPEASPQGPPQNDQEWTLFHPGKDQGSGNSIDTGGEPPTWEQILPLHWSTQGYAHVWPEQAQKQQE